MPDYKLIERSQMPTHYQLKHAKSFYCIPMHDCTLHSTSLILQFDGIVDDGDYDDDDDNIRTMLGEKYQFNFGTTYSQIENHYHFIWMHFRNDHSKWLT